MTDHIKIYHMVELREGSIYNAGALAEAKNAWAIVVKAEHTGPAYRSAFLFADDVRKHVAESIIKSEKKKPSLRG